jgi:outer membrane protein assembly factor BamB
MKPFNAMAFEKKEMGVMLKHELQAAQDPLCRFIGSKRAFLVVLLLAIATAGQSLAAGAVDSEWAHQWPQWRGPSADGIAAHARPPIHWSKTENIRWKQPLPGEGSATPIVWQDQIFVVAAVKTDRIAKNPPKADARAKTNPPANIYEYVVLSLDRKTGKERWRRVACEDAPHEGRHPANSFASSSPMTDGKRLYVSFGSRGIFCFDLTGRQLWQRDLGDMRTRYGWGEGTSPVVHGDSLIINWDHEDQSFIEVLNAKTGKTRWKADRDEPTTWATPLVVVHKGRTQVIVNGTNRVRSYDLETGEVIWQCGGQTVNAIPSPLAAEGVVYVMSGYRSAAAVAVSLDARGDLGDGATAIKWRYGRGTPYVPSPILLEDQLYFTRRNSAVISSLNIATGKPIFTETRLPALSSIYASPVSAQGRIYLVGRDGTTLVIQHGPKLKVLATNRLDDAIDASPVLVGKQLFLRSARHLYCIEETDK